MVAARQQLSLVDEPRSEVILQFTQEDLERLWEDGLIPDESYVWFRWMADKHHVGMFDESDRASIVVNPKSVEDAVLSYSTPRKTLNYKSLVKKLLSKTVKTQDFQLRLDLEIHSGQR